MLHPWQQRGLWLGAQGAPMTGSSLPSPPAVAVGHLSVAAVAS